MKIKYSRDVDILTIKVSETPADHAEDQHESDRLTGALLDRLTHLVNILEMNGESYRLNQSRSRLAKANE